MAKVCIGVCVAVGIITDVDIVTYTKYYTVSCRPRNSMLRTSHQALERWQSFVIDDREYERFRSACITSTGLCRNRKTYNPSLIDL